MYVILTIIQIVSKLCLFIFLYTVPARITYFQIIFVKNFVQYIRLFKVFFFINSKNIFPIFILTVSLYGELNKIIFLFHIHLLLLYSHNYNLDYDFNERTKKNI